MSMENTKIEEFDDEVIEEFEEATKESFVDKGKNFFTRNKKEILAIGLALITGMAGYVLGSRSDSSDLIDADYTEVHSAIEDGSESEDQMIE